MFKFSKKIKEGLKAFPADLQAQAAAYGLTVDGNTGEVFLLSSGRKVSVLNEGGDYDTGTCFYSSFADAMEIADAVKKGA